MSSRGSQYATGKVIATNATLNIRSVGFVPDRVKLLNVDNDCMFDWNNMMADGTGFKTIKAGDRTLEVTTGITPLAESGSDGPGFSIGAEADINDTTTEGLIWIASRMG
jgi:hypothetical protein